MTIPILDLLEQYRTIREEIDDAIHGVLEGGDFILGPNVKALEQEVAQYCGCTYGIGVASGTDALRLAMDALEIDVGAFFALGVVDTKFAAFGKDLALLQAKLSF